MLYTNKVVGQCKSQFANSFAHSEHNALLTLVKALMKLQATTMRKILSTTEWLNASLVSDVRCHPFPKRLNLHLGHLGSGIECRLECSAADSCSERFEWLFPWLGLNLAARATWIVSFFHRFCPRRTAAVWQDRGVPAIAANLHLWLRWTSWSEWGEAFLSALALELVRCDLLKPLEARIPKSGEATFLILGELESDSCFLELRLSTSPLQTEFKSCLCRNRTSNMAALLQACLHELNGAASNYFTELS